MTFKLQKWIITSPLNSDFDTTTVSHFPRGSFFDTISNNVASFVSKKNPCTNTLVTNNPSLNSLVILHILKSSRMRFAAEDHLFLGHEVVGDYEVSDCKLYTFIPRNLNNIKFVSHSLSRTSPGLRTTMTVVSVFFTTPMLERSTVLRLITYPQRLSFLSSEDTSTC